MDIIHAEFAVDNCRAQSEDKSGRSSREKDEEEVEEVEVEEEVEEEDDAGTVSLKAFTVRGRDGQDRDYYRDPDNLVYALDADGELIDDPIGRWDEARQKILKLAV